MLGGTTMIKEHSRLWGYLSGKPGDSMRPVGLVKFREQSEPERETQERKGKERIRNADVGVMRKIDRDVMVDIWFNLLPSIITCFHECLS